MVWCNITASKTYDIFLSYSGTSVPLYIVAFLTIPVAAVSYLLGKSDVYSKPRLVIYSAVYGGMRGTVDVTKQLRRLIRKNALSVTVGNQLAGDPAPNTIKTLVVSYSYDGEPLRKDVRELDRLELP